MAEWSFACPDWEDRLREGRTLIPDLPLDAQAADRAAAIFDRLRIPDVVGQPPMSEAAGAWFRDIVRAAFGSLDQTTGERMVAEIFALVPKKNSKTTYSGALGVVALLLNERPNADMLVIGPTQDVADLCFTQAKGMIEADPEGYLPDRFHIQEHLKTITCRVTGAKLRIKSFDMRVMTGQKPVLVIVDELHIMSAFSYASRVLGQIRGGLLPFPESLLVFITTQSDMPPSGAFKSELDHARAVRDGRATKGSRKLPVLYEFPEAVQIDRAKPWRDPKLWPMVLPNLGKSITLDRLIRDFAEARDKGIEEEARWATQHLNVQMGLALHSDRWIGADLWDAAGSGPRDLEDLMAECDVCTVGIDGGGLDDLLGLAVIGRRRSDRAWIGWARAWAQPEVFERRKEIAQTLRDFQAQGDLIVCEDPTQDLIEVSDIIERLKLAKLLPKQHGTGLDPYGVAALVDELANRGIEGDELVGIGQGTRLSPAVWGMERKLKDGTFRHGGAPMMSWCVGNAKAEQRGNAVLITKQAAGVLPSSTACVFMVEPRRTTKSAGRRIEIVAPFL